MQDRMNNHAELAEDPPMDSDCLSGYVAMTEFMNILYKVLSDRGVQLTLSSDQLSEVSAEMLQEAKKLQCCWRKGECDYYQWDPVLRKWLNTKCTLSTSVTADCPKPATWPAVAFCIYQDAGCGGGTLA